MAVDLNPADAQSWWSWVSNFDNTYAQFNANYNGLIAQAPYVKQSHPELLPQYTDLVNRGAAHAKTLADLKATRDYVSSWLTWLQSGIQSGVNFVESNAQAAYDAAKAALGLGDIGLRGLGIAPVVVIGVAAAAAALVIIGYWIKDAFAFAQRLNALKAQEDRLQAAGIPADQAARQAQAIVDKTLGPAPGTAGAIDNNLLGIPWTWLIFGAVAIFLGPPLIEAMSGKERR